MTDEREDATMNEEIKNNALNDEELEVATGGAWTGNETELTCVCAGCRAITKFEKVNGTWRCTMCNGTETMSYQDL